MHFLPISHIFPNFQTNIIIKISIYIPKEIKKKKKHNSTNPTLDHDSEREIWEKKQRVEAAAARLRERSSDGELKRERERSNDDEIGGEI